MSGLRQFTPPSIKGLNYNIDADLNLTSGHKISCMFLELVYDTAHCNIYRGNDTDKLSIGAGLQSDCSARITLHGKNESTNPGNIYLQVPNSGSTGFQNVITCHGKTDTPYADLNTWRIQNLGAPTTDADAVPQTKMWGSWTPTLTWFGGTPSSITAQYRYMQIGKTVFIAINVYSADSNACTNLNISLPVTPSTNVGFVSLTSAEVYGVAGASRADPLATINTAGTVIGFLAFQVGTDNQLIRIVINGFYEV